MAVNTKTLNQMLYDQLYGVGFNPVSLNTKGQPTEDAKEADVFRFMAKDKQGKQIGTGWFTIDNGKLTLFADPDFIKNPSIEEFTTFMKNWARHKRLSWEIKNRQDLVPQMTKRKVMKEKEQLGEGYYPMGKKASYNDSVPTVKILIQHNRQIEEGEQRFRNIEKIFVENVNGEKFLLPTKRPGLARVYARHVAEGGTPYDDKGKHITSLVEEYTKMAGFVRATRNGQFNESTQRLVTEGINHYQNLRETLSRMTSHRGYNKYFESYTPVLNEESEDNTNLNELFVQETLDPRIESVLPILNRLSKNITEMSAVKELEEWATTITEVEDETTKTLAEPAEDMLDEAPGAETLAHNDSTEKSNLKAFDLAEGFSDSREVADEIIGSMNLPDENITSDDLYRAVEEFQTMMDNPDELDVDEVVQIMMDRLDFQDDKEETLEDLDANQKRVGQLGPTEPVGKNEKNLRGKLVGASESREFDNIKRLAGLK